MATWMAHLRVADKLLDHLDNIDQTAFIMGNIAPDSGVPTENGYVPDKNTSHFKITGEDGHNTYGWRIFAEQYLTPEKIKKYDKKQCSFYLGYLTHLLADVQWVELVGKPLKERDIENYRKNKNATYCKWKKDWYDLDHKFIRDNPDFRAFYIYKNTVNFKNTYLDFFSETAFAERQLFIVDFYSHRHDDLDREYIWLTEDEMNAYIEKTIDFVLKTTADIRAENKNKSSDS